MRSSLLVASFIGLAFAKAYAQQPIATDSVTVSKTVVEPQYPSDAIHEFFKYFHAKDTTAMRAMMIDYTPVKSLIISESKGKSMLFTPIDEFLKGIAQIPDSVSFEERLIQVKSTNSSDIASVSTTYEFYMNDGFTHNGVNVFTLIYIDDKWKIAAIVDTRQYP